MASEAARKAEYGRKAHANKGRTRSDGAVDVKLPQDGKPGNTKIDQEWVREHEQEFSLIPDLDEVPFGARQQWSGKAADIGSMLQIPNPENKCIGRAFIRDGEGRRIIDADGLVLTRPCSKWRMRGSLVCTHHGGLTDGGLAIAKRRLQESADSVVGRLIKIALSKKTLDGEAIKAINSILDRAGIRVGSDIQVDTPAWQGMLSELFLEGGKNDGETVGGPTIPSDPAPAEPVVPKRPGRRSVPATPKAKGK